MPSSPRERLRNIMMAHQHRTRTPEDTQIDLLELVSHLLIDLNARLAAQQPGPAVPVRQNGRHQTAA